MQKLFDVLVMANRKICKFEKGFSFAILLAMVAISFGQVVVRNVFAFGFMWADQVLRACVLWLAFLGASLATDYARHIRVDIFPRYLTGKRQKFVEISATLFLLVGCIFFAYAAWDYMIVKYHSNLNIFLRGIPDWIIVTILPYFFIMTIFRSTLHIQAIMVKQGNSS